MAKQTLLEKIKQIRRNCRPVTNCYTMECLEQVVKYWESGESFAFAFLDHGVERLIYFAVDQEALQSLLAAVPKGQYCLEFLAKDISENFALLSGKGFACLAKMMRMATHFDSAAFAKYPVSKFADETIGFYPEAALAPEINRVLWNVFDTRVSHLQSNEELKTSIKSKEVLIHQSDDGKIDAILQTVVQPRRFYINQVYNGAEKNVIHAMLQNSLNKYAKAGGKYVYAWVDCQNIASVKFHQKYGLQHDGMWSMVYVLNKG